MHRVLFIAYDFPPGIVIAGGLRSENFVHYLPAFSWQPTVVAMDNGQEPAPDVIRLPSLTPWHSPFEVTPYGWAYALHRYLRNCTDSFDLVYVSCPPYPHALAAAAFAHRRQLPLVVDFRDACSLNPYHQGSRLKQMLYRQLFKSIEKRLIAKTDLLILNTPSALRAYQSLYPAHAGKMAWLPNGYDERAFPEEMPAPGCGKFVMLYAGQFGTGRRSPASLLTGMTLARQNGCDAHLVILGTQSEPIQAQILSAGLGDAVELRGQIDYSQAVAKMCTASVLVLVQASSQMKVQAVAGKTFDYLRAGRPILAIGPEGDNIDLLSQYAHRYEHPADEPESIARAITRLYKEWKRGEHQESRIAPEFTDNYERRALTEKLAAHFDRLANPDTQ